MVIFNGYVKLLKGEHGFGFYEPELGYNHGWLWTTFQVGYTPTNRRKVQLDMHPILNDTSGFPPIQYEQLYSVGKT